MFVSMLLHLTTLEDSPDLAHTLTSYCRDMALPVDVELDGPKRLISGDGERVFSYVLSLDANSGEDKAAAKQLLSEHPDVRSLANAL